MAFLLRDTHDAGLMPSEAHEHYIHQAITRWLTNTDGIRISLVSAGAIEISLFLLIERYQAKSFPPPARENIHARCRMQPLDYVGSQVHFPSLP
jgi:hypothetical protein